MGEGHVDVGSLLLPCGEGEQMTKILPETKAGEEVMAEGRIGDLISVWRDG